MLSKYLLPPDVFIRHWLIAGEVQKSRIKKLSKTSLLDVGGSLGEIRKFLPDIKVITTDVVPGADILYDGKKLPFKKEEYDFVVSIDTLEHIPVVRRLDLIGQMTDVAKRKVILVAPFASTEHDKYEKKLVEKYNLDKLAVPRYLQEHRKYGLITTSQLEDIQDKYPSALCRLVGYVGLDELNFKVHMFEINFGKLNRIIYYLKFIWNIILNLLSPWIIFNQNKVSASRALIIIEKL